ncbi:MAG TPA: OmpA family protein [Phycisphaerae bacterium]|nr:OmpA family protein [Phycisphaerae bacterium]
MSSVRMMTLAAGLGILWTSTGCVSRDEYLREKFARRKAVERCETLERDLADERNRVMALETERESLRNQLAAKSELADNYQSERDRLQEYIAKLQGDLDRIGAQGLGDVKVVEVKLPPELDRALQEFAAKYPDAVEYDAKRGAVRWKSDLTFDKGSDNVRQNVMDSLRAFAQIVNSAAAQPFEVVVVGHTDNLRIVNPATAQNHPTNWHLSVHRSIAVMNVLAQTGVSSSRLGVMGYGEYRPRVDNPSRGGTEANRRVEIFLVATNENVPMETAAIPDSSEVTEMTGSATEEP